MGAESRCRTEDQRRWGPPSENEFSQAESGRLSTSRVLLFDLDETLIPEEDAVVAAFRETAYRAQPWIAIGAEEFAALARRTAKARWRENASYDYCRRVGISSEEALWARFDQHAPNTEALREASAIYRQQAWGTSLRQAGAQGTPSQVEQLSRWFEHARIERCTPFEGVVHSLMQLRARFKLGIVTNGPACLQRRKLRQSKLDKYFQCVVVSGQEGIGKPEATIYELAASRLGAKLDATVMIGDSLERDVWGATAAGLRGTIAIRAGRQDLQHEHAINRIDELPQLMAGPW
jgi:putative hydrolase of the HAD superfamily